MAGWRDGRKGTRSSDSSRQSESLLVVFEEKEKLTWGRGLGLGRGASGKSTAGRRCCGTRRCKSQSPEQVPKKKTLWALCGRRELSSAPRPPSAATSCLPPGRHHAACPRCCAETGQASDFVIAREQSCLKIKNDKKTGKSCACVRPSRLCFIYCSGCVRLKRRNFRFIADVLLFWKNFLPVSHLV